MSESIEKFTKQQLELISKQHEEMMVRDLAIEFLVAQRKIENLTKEKHHHMRKWQELERDYVLPLFKRAKERGWDLAEAVHNNPGKNCVILYAEHGEAAEAKLIAQVERIATLERQLQHHEEGTLDLLYADMRDHIRALEAAARDALSKIDDCDDGKINFRRDFGHRLRAALIPIGEKGEKNG